MQIFYMSLISCIVKQCCRALVFRQLTGVPRAGDGCGYNFSYCCHYQSAKAPLTLETVCKT